MRPILAQFFAYFVLDIKFKICTLCWGGGLSVSVGTELGQFVFCELPDNNVSRKMLGGHSKKYPKGMAKR